MKLPTFFMIVSLGVFGSSELLDLGQLDQYRSRPGSNKIPDLRGDSLWISSKDAKGFDIVLSNSTKAKIQGVLEGCGEPSDRCHQEVRNILRSSRLEIDHELTRGSFMKMLSGALKRSMAVFSTIAAILKAKWLGKDNDAADNGMFIPVSKAEDAGAKLATASALTIAAAGSIFITVTPTPEPSKLQGRNPPSITPFNEVKEGFVKGDLAVILDKDLASRIDEVMHRATQCEDGRKFDSEHGTRKRSGASLGEAICAAEAVAGMAVPGGTFNDILLIDPNQMPFGWADPGADVARAAGVVVDFILAYAPLLVIGPELAEQIGNFLFILSLETLMGNKPVQETNRIPSSLVTATKTSPTSSTTSASSTSGCPDPTKTPIWCGFNPEPNDCDMKVIDDNKPTCGSGEYQGCLCDPPTQTFTNAYSANEQQSMNVMLDLLEKIDAPPGTGSNKQDNLNIVLEMKSDYNNGIPLYEFNYLFYVTEKGADSLCALFPTAVYGLWLRDWRTVGPPTGIYSFNVPKQPGCEYMNDGKGNAGAVWCGAKVTSCHFNRIEGTSWADRSCVNLNRPGHGVRHQAIVYCGISR
ncbi:hypothetical protein BKA63DRAFT_521179 [Paraphoma chrysanthemicola]|nr:hypothetical protein BKA63DRAFT_521179 [Paraphoma chrysanthemicola]